MAVAPSHHLDAPHLVELLYRQHARALRSYCRRQVGPDDADEVLQTTFLRALSALRRGERPYAERAWLLTIARNVCASRATSAARRHELLDDGALESAAAPTAADDHDVDLGAALRALPEGQRRAFVLRAVHDLSYAEIAAELDVSRAAVEAWIFRARRKLACAVGERRRRLALDLSSAAGAAKSLVAANALKVAAVTVAAGTAITVGPASPDRPPAARPPAASSVREVAPTLPRTTTPVATETRPWSPGREPSPTHPVERPLPGTAVAAAPVTAPETAPPERRPPAADSPVVAAPPALAETLPDSPALELPLPLEPVTELLPPLDTPELPPALAPALEPLPGLDPPPVLPTLP